MKKSTLIILIILNISIGFAQSLRSLNYDLMGVLNFNSTLIAYGNSGNYLTSIDKGNNWSDHTLSNNSLIDNDIIKIVNYDNILVGITNSHCVIQNESANDNLKLKVGYYNASLDFFDIYTSDRKFYILARHSILVLNEKLEIDETINLPDSINILANNKIVVVNNEIYFTANQSKVYSIKNKMLTQVYDFQKITFCINCSIDSFTFSDNVFYASYNQFVYSSNNKFKDVISSNAKNTNRIKIQDNHIYGLKLKSDVQSNGFDNFYIYNTVNDMYEQNNTFNELYFAFGNLGNDFEIINNKEFIVVGKNKYISKSIDSGKSWKVISMFNNLKNNNIINWSNDSCCIVASISTDIQYTTNKGITWQATDYNKDLNREDPFIAFPLGFYVNEYGAGASFLSTFYYNIKNLCIISDFGKTTKVIERSNNIPNDNTYFIQEKSQNQRYAINNDLIFPTRQTSLIITDTNFNFIKNIKFKNFYLEQVKIYNDNHFQVLGYSNVNGEFSMNADSLYYYYFETFDKGNTFDTVFSFKAHSSQKFILPIKDIIQINSSNGYFLTHDSVGSTSTKAQIYKYEKNIVILFYEFKDNTYGYKLYLNSRNNFELIIYSNKNISILEKINNEWTNLFTDSSLSSISNICKTQNSLFFTGKYKNSQRRNLFELIFDQPTSKVDSQTEDQTYFYSYPPFPIPAMNELKSLIYWDMSYNIDDSNIGVYDIYGNKIANRDKISINKLNAYSGYLTWDCSGASTGVYMIQIKHGTNTHNIRAMVVR